MQKLSIVVPVYDEELNLQPFYQALLPVLENLYLSSEIIFVNDGSKDRSQEIITELAIKNPRVKGILFSRNFGSHAAILAGLRAASGDAAVIISADLQDPPEIIASLVKKWFEGNHVVWAVRQTRKDPFLKSLFAGFFYAILRKVALPNYPRQGMDFGLFDRKVINALAEIRETNQFIMGLISWLGFKQDFVYYERRARERGVSKWPFWKRVKAALDAIVSFSYFPIRFISYFGLFVSSLSMVYAVFLLFNHFFFHLGTPGWSSLMVAILFLGGIQLITLGIIGEYVWRGSDQVKGRPQYVIMEKVNFDESDSHKTVAHESYRNI